MSTTRATHHWVGHQAKLILNQNAENLRTFFILGKCKVNISGTYRFSIDLRADHDETRLQVVTKGVFITCSDDPICI